MRRTLLLADDSVTIRKIVELTFSESDIRVESVASGREALDRLQELRPDLVLADVVMPGPSGYEVCRAIKESDRPVPVLLLAGTFEPFDAVQARACGSDGHVTKPFDSRQLVERVEALLAGGAAPRLSVERQPGPPVDDLDAMFDDLAAPEHPGTIDVRPADVAPARIEADPIDERPAASPASGSTKAESEAPTLTAADIDAIARRVVERISDRVLREIAWDVVPDLADIIVRERIRELERDSS
jgi:DNA-binding response OmpR family regulator